MRVLMLSNVPMRCCDGWATGAESRRSTRQARPWRGTKACCDEGYDRTKLNSLRNLVPILSGLTYGSDFVLHNINYANLLGSVADWTKSRNSAYRLAAANAKTRTQIPPTAPSPATLKPHERRFDS